MKPANVFLTICMVTAFFAVCHEPESISFYAALLYLVATPLFVVRASGHSESTRRMLVMMMSCIGILLYSSCVTSYQSDTMYIILALSFILSTLAIFAFMDEGYDVMQGIMSLNAICYLFSAAAMMPIPLSVGLVAAAVMYALIAFVALAHYMQRRGAT